MQEQIWKLENQTAFEPMHIFECGQCFRWNQIEKDTYRGIFGQNVIDVKKEKNIITFSGNCEKPIQEVVKKYFDLDRDYEAIKAQLIKQDSTLEQSMQYGYGIRLLNQDLWETIISFIISANNNIPRIKSIIERLAKNYGTPIKWKDTTYYTFPTPEQLSKASVEDLRKLGLGFRDKRVWETTKKVVNKEIQLQDWYKEKSLETVREQLLELPGVGPKVADCILLFSDLKRLEVFPNDVWVRRVMNELYIQKEESKVTRREIEKIAKEKYGALAGIAQQYLFYWKREA